MARGSGRAHARVRKPYSSSPALQPTNAAATSQRSHAPSGCAWRWSSGRRACWLLFCQEARARTVYEPSPHAAALVYVCSPVRVLCCLCFACGCLRTRACLRACVRVRAWSCSARGPHQPAFSLTDLFLCYCSFWHDPHAAAFLHIVPPLGGPYTRTQPPSTARLLPKALKALPILRTWVMPAIPMVLPSEARHTSTRGPATQPARTLRTDGAPEHAPTRASTHATARRQSTSMHTRSAARRCSTRCAVLQPTTQLPTCAAPPA